MHGHHHACILRNRDDFLEEVLQVLPQLGTLCARFEVGSECRASGNSCLVEISQTECSHLGAGTFKGVDGGTNPVGAGHEVVAHEANVQVRQVANQGLHRAQIRSVVRAQLDAIDGKVTLHDTDLHAE